MGYIGEDITDGRWQKIEYDNITDCCFYCKHQGHKEVECIVKKRDEENKKRKELEKNKTTKDNVQNLHTDVQVARDMDTDRRGVDYNQQRNPSTDIQQQGITDEWQVQRRRNNNQQVRFHSDKAVIQQHQPHTGMASITTKNTYIDLELQEGTSDDGVRETHIKQLQEQRYQYNVTEGNTVHRDQRNKQQRQEAPSNRNVQNVYKKAVVTNTEPGMETGEEASTSYHVQTGPLLHTSNIDEIRDVTGKQGLSPRGRKTVKQNKITSISKPNTRARSRGN
ncbi:hypothetical protein EJD97_008292 [Solanum chilense]|uniref:Uncharacterized protein n=1 Tax=Solanum chilense TaxID=4083 RepID=A0A6N2AKR8_SOLCI|nr:hypothetical protein EJD97_008292 [Solanum chilense]